MSSRKLFTKIYEAKPQHAEHAAHQMVRALISNSHNVLQDKRLTKLNTHALQKQVINQEVEKIRQAYAPDPTEPSMPQDLPTKKKVNERVRPYSAQIQRVQVQPSQEVIQVPPKKGLRRFASRHKSNRSSQAMSTSRASVNSQSVKKTRYHPRYFNKEPERFYPIPKHNPYNDEDSFDEAFYDELRRKKEKEEQQQRQKERFIKTSVDYGNQYNKLNRKFQQSMANKTYYYSDNGEALQLPQNKQKRALRKMKASGNGRSRNEAGPVVVEREVERPEERFVEFAEKENVLRTSKEEFEVGRPVVLFYRSDNCAYEVVS